MRNFFPWKALAAVAWQMKKFDPKGKVPRKANLVPCIGISVLISAIFWTSGAAFASATYNYDQIGRLVSVLYDNGSCVAYSYDPNGNRVAQTVLPPGSANGASGSPITPVWGTGVWGCMSWTAQGGGTASNAAVGHGARPYPKAASAVGVSMAVRLAASSGRGAKVDP